MSGRPWRDNLQLKSTANAAKFAPPKRRSRRSREKRYRAEVLPLSPQAAESVGDGSAPDPVHMAVLAMETLGPASMRASCTGTAVEVLAPDASVAAIFRAVLAETSRWRATDRLIRIVVE